MGCRSEPSSASLSLLFSTFDLSLCCFHVCFIQKENVSYHSRFSRLALFVLNKRLAQATHIIHRSAKLKQLHEAGYRLSFLRDNSATSSDLFTSQISNYSSELCHRVSCILCLLAPCAAFFTFFSFKTFLFCFFL